MEEFSKVFDWLILTNIDALLSPEMPKVAFAASLGGNGLVKTTTGNRNLIYRDVLTNVGGAYNKDTGELSPQTKQCKKINK